MSERPFWPGIGHNGGPPLEGGFQWGDAPVDVYFAWKRAYDQVWKEVSYHTMIRRVRKAGELGLTYEEYVMEILFNGRYLQVEDTERIAEIKGARKS